jgi:hypothetical protein
VAGISSFDQTSDRYHLSSQGDRPAGPDRARAQIHPVGAALASEGEAQRLLSLPVFLAGVPSSSSTSFTTSRLDLTVIGTPVSE